jgi:cell division protein FtsN
MSSNQYPGWAYMLAGLVIGLFVAFLIYLRNLPSPGTAHNQTAQTGRERNDSPKPDFKFYEILPELEVIVPELEVSSREKDRQPASKPELPAPTPQLQQGEKFILQAGSFSQFDEADKLKAHLALLGVEAQIQKVSVDNKTWHRVRIGPFTDRQSLNVTRRRLRENNIDAITLKVSG